jgi:hypothetical protein
MRSMATNTATNPTAATAPPLICTIGAAAVLEDALDEELPVDEGEEPDETTDVELAVPQEAAEGRFVTPPAEQIS